jgi:hypothetical protein
MSGSGSTTPTPNTPHPLRVATPALRSPTTSRLYTSSPPDPNTSDTRPEHSASARGHRPALDPETSTTGLATAPGPSYSSSTVILPEALPRMHVRSTSSSSSRDDLADTDEPTVVQRFEQPVMGEPPAKKKRTRMLLTPYQSSVLNALFSQVSISIRLCTCALMSFSLGFPPPPCVKRLADPSGSAHERFR